MNEADTKARGDAPPAPPAPDGDAQSSGMRVEGLPALVRMGLIALVAFAALAFGLRQGRRMPGLPAWPAAPSPREPDLSALPGDFPLLAGDVALASEPVTINGRRVDAVRFASARPPAAVVEALALRLEPLGYAVVSGAKGSEAAGRFVRLGGPGQAMLAFRDREGRFMGVVAFANPTSGGSDYFVTRDLEAADDTVPGAEVEGEEPDPSMRPVASRREYWIERGDPRSILALYWCDARPEMVAEIYRARLPGDGWAEPAGSPEAFAGAPEGTHLMFHKGRDRCLVHVSDEEGAGCWVTLVYREGRR